MIPELQKQFLKCIESVTKYDNYTVFADVIGLASASIRAGTKHSDGEADYMLIAKKYNSEELTIISKAFAIITMLMEEYRKINRYVDVLGELFHILNLNSKQRGQFFTPQHLADLMGNLSFDKDVVLHELATRGYISLSEPACGGGANIFGYATKLEAMGIPVSLLLVEARDIDKRCIDMCYVQCSLYGIPAKLVHGDTLAMSEFDTYFTPVYVWNNWAIREAMKCRI